MREDEPPVGDVPERCEAAGADPPQLVRCSRECRVERDPAEHEEQGGEEPLGAAYPERGERDAVGIALLGEQQAHDEEAAEDEERARNPPRAHDIPPW